MNAKLHDGVEVQPNTAETPPLLTRLRFENGDVHYVFVPAHQDLLKEWESGPKTPDAFMRRLYKEGILEANVPVTNDLELV